MEHLTNAMEKLLKPTGKRLGQSFLGDVHRYLSAEDAKLLPKLLKLSETEMNTLCWVAKAVPRPDKWGDADLRLIEFFIRRSALLNGVDKREHIGQCSDWPLAHCLRRHLEVEKPNEDFCGALRTKVMSLGIPESRWLLLVARHVEPRAVNERLTSAGRYLASQPVDKLMKVLPALRYHCTDTVFMPAFAAEFPENLAGLMDELIAKKQVDGLPRGGWLAALKCDAARFESRVAAAFELMRDEEEKSLLAKGLEKHFPGKYRKQTVKAASSIGAALGGEEQAAAARWLIEQQGEEAIPAITDYIAKWNLKNPYIQDWKIEVLRAAAKLLGRKLKPALEAAMQKDLPELRHGALELRIGFNDPAEDSALEELLLKELSADAPKLLLRFIPLSASWNVKRIAPRLWPLMEHNSKPVREAAAQALSKLGDEAVPKAIELLAARKADTRKAAVTLLMAVASEDAQRTLRDHLIRESAPDVRDLIQKALVKGVGKLQPAEANSPAGHVRIQKASMVDQKQVEAAIASAAPKIKDAPAAWIKESALPAIYFVDGKTLERDAVRYLLYRQSREKEITADTEAALLYAVIDRKRSGEFALAVLTGYLGSALDAKDRWALALAGILGDDRIVPILTKRIAEWAEAARGKLAEYAVQALALLASDASLLAVDAMSIRYRTKFKNIGKAASQAFAAAADARGLSPAELGDRVLPWLGFEPGKARLFEFGGSRVEVSVGLDFKLAWRDLVKGKVIKSLPAGAPDDVKAEVKELSASLKEAAKAQLLRMENLMVQQHRWAAPRWAELFLKHPLVFPFAARLVWGAFGTDGKLAATFRALEDRSLTDANDESFTLPVTGQVGIVHPLELTPDQRQAWLKHLADYNVVTPFAQLERPVVTLKPGQEDIKGGDDFDQVELNAMTFKGRAERLGWSRGSVVDAGGINYYYKQFPAAGVDVFIALEGMYVGIDMYSDITLGQVMFVKHRSVQIGGYTYDEPSGDKDERLVTFGSVPAIAFSEAMGDLAKISGKSGAQRSEEADA
ncbi:MAG TPA: DUF4132 domain-containing protein [Verrucomicrobiota bacterium]|nr:hypothetical protein [Verrucomicrobiales bacterium]HRI11505.1 DUF4132 domain-containing protein [Verrucomicrobiota bacterium]